MMYWTTGATLAVLLFISTPDIKEKNKIYSEYLYEPIKCQCEQLSQLIFYKKDQDIIQDGLLYSLNYLNRIKPCSYKASQEYSWTNLKYYFINVKKSQRIQYDKTVNINDLDIMQKEYNYDINYEIIEAIDQKLLNIHTVNTKKGIFLLILKDYLISNDFDERGFCEYCCEVMNINKQNYWQVANTLGIRTILFNKKNKNNNNCI